MQLNWQDAGAICIIVGAVCTLNHFILRLIIDNTVKEATGDLEKDTRLRLHTLRDNLSEHVAKLELDVQYIKAKLNRGSE